MIELGRELALILCAALIGADDEDRELLRDGLFARAHGDPPPAGYWEVREEFILQGEDPSSSEGTQS